MRVSKSSGIAVKHLLEAGHQSRAFQKQAESNSYLAEAIRLETGKVWEPGTPPPDGLSEEVLENYFRNARYEAVLFSEVGRCVEAMNQIQRICDAARQNGQDQGHYAIQLVSQLAGEQKFLGYRKASTANLSRILELSPPGSSAYESARLNLAYWRSQVEGPVPAFLAEAREASSQLDRLTSNQATEIKNRRRMLARMAFAYRESGFDIGDLQSLVKQAEQAGEEMQAVYARRDLALIQLGQGDFDAAEANLLRVLAEHRSKGRKRGEPSVYRAYGQLLISSGRPAEAVQVLNEALRQTRSFGWVQHLPPLMIHLAQAQGQAGDLEGLASTLRELDRLSASGELEPDRVLDCGVAMSLCHQLLGNRSEAAQKLGQALGRAKAEKVHHWEIRWAEQYFENSIQALAPATGSTTAIIPGADLQPSRVDSVVTTAEAALSRFTLSNPSSSDVVGTLVLAGENLSAEWLDAAGLCRLSVVPTGGVKELRRQFKLEGGDEFLLTASTHPGQTGQVSLRWEPLVGLTQSSIWNFSTSGDDGFDVAVTNASLAKRNPFYALRLHHSITRRKGLSEAPVDFRILASSPVRIEIVEADTGQILAVDAQGDGTLSEAGDLLVSDSNHDGVCDVRCPVGKAMEFGLVLYPQGGTKAVGGDITLEVQLRGDKGWETVAKDIVRDKSGK